MLFLVKIVYVMRSECQMMQKGWIPIIFGMVGFTALEVLLYSGLLV
jgi:hypothetical protein